MKEWVCKQRLGENKLVCNCHNSVDAHLCRHCTISRSICPICNGLMCHVEGKLECASCKFEEVVING